MKTVWIDIFHPAQLNFYINSIKLLKNHYKIVVTVLGRGKLPQIAKKELSGIENVEILVIGKHQGSKISSIVDVNILYLKFLISFLLNRRVDLHFSMGHQGSLLSYLFSYPAITFGDDPNTVGFYLKLILSDKTYQCLYSKKFARLPKRAKIFPCLKEWAYLNPKYFKADESALKEYGLTAYNYIFIREVSTGTVNYTGQKSGLIHLVKDKIPDQYSVIFSLEDKKNQYLYPDNWILLEEPVRDIHSLIFYSRTLISSGDSMAREAAVLGNPAIYLGIRTMPANEVVKQLVDFYQVDGYQFADTLKSCLNDFSVQQKNNNMDKISALFVDINEYILNLTRKILG